VHFEHDFEDSKDDQDAVQRNKKAPARAESAAQPRPKNKTEQALALCDKGLKDLRFPGNKAPG
jgi:hypothetical protein